MIVNRALIQAGVAGHDREITVSFDLWGHGAPLDNTEGPIPAWVEGQVREHLPESWRVENRGSRLEVHPSGRFAGGYHEDDVRAVEETLHSLGFEYETREGT